MENLIESVHAILSITPNRWNDMMSVVPVELLSHHPLPGEWSALECSQHLIDVETLVFPVRFKAFLVGENIQDFDPHKMPKDTRIESPEQLASRFTGLRAENMRLFDRIAAKDLRRSVSHSSQGTVTLGEMLHEWAGHDLVHLVQAERAIMQPFIAGSGSWRLYFADHDVEAVKRS